MTDSTGKGVIDLTEIRAFSKDRCVLLAAVDQRDAEITRLLAIIDESEPFERRIHWLEDGLRIIDLATRPDGMVVNGGMEAIGDIAREALGVPADRGEDRVKPRCLPVTVLDIVMVSGGSITIYPIRDSPVATRWVVYYQLGGSGVRGIGSTAHLAHTDLLAKLAEREAKV